jgi:hypothetical protein
VPFSSWHRSFYDSLKVVTEDGSDPPEAEIAEIEKRKKEVQQRWTPAIWEERCVHKATQWSLPMYCSTFVDATPFASSRRRNKRVKIYRRLP